MMMSSKFCHSGLKQVTTRWKSDFIKSRSECFVYSFRMVIVSSSLHMLLHLEDSVHILYVSIHLLNMLPFAFSDTPTFHHNQVWKAGCHYFDPLFFLCISTAIFLCANWKCLELTFRTEVSLMLIVTKTFSQKDRSKCLTAVAPCLSLHTYILILFEFKCSYPANHIAFPLFIKIAVRYKWSTAFRLIGNLMWWYQCCEFLCEYHEAELSRN